MALSFQSLVANLAPTVFQGNAKDTVATPDVYGITTTSIINTLVGKFNPFDGALLNNLRPGSTGILGSITGSSSFLSGIGRISLTNSSILGRVSSAAGGGFGNLSGSMQTSIASNLSLGSGSFSSLDVTIGGLTRSLSSVLDISTMGNALSLINQVTGNSRMATYVDVGATSSVLGASIQQLISSGMSSSVPTVIAGVSSQTAIKQALVNSVPTAIQYGDVDTIQLATTTAGVAAINKAVPQTALQVIKAYSIPAGTTTDQYPSLCTKLQTLLTSLQAGWDTYNRNGTASVSLTYFQAASPDALKVLATNAAYTVACKLAKFFPSGASLTALKQQYPFMLIPS